MRNTEIKNMKNEILDKLELFVGLKFQYIEMFENKEDNMAEIEQIKEDRNLFIKELNENGITEEIKEKTYAYCDDALELYSKFMNNFLGNETIDKEDSTQRIEMLRLKLESFKNQLESFSVAVG